MTAVNEVQQSTSTVADPQDRLAHGDGARRALNVRFGVGDGRDVALGHVHRPTWRGGIHSIGLVVAVPAVGALLVASSGEGWRLQVGIAVYAVGLCSMLAASTIYHRWVHGLRARCTWRRVDHAAIFAAIAGSSTPIVLAALPGATGLVLVGVIWAAAFVGAGFKLSTWEGGDRAGTALYAVTITLGVLAFPWLWAREGIGPAASFRSERLLGLAPMSNSIAAQPDIHSIVADLLPLSLSVVAVLREWPGLLAARRWLGRHA